MSQASGESGIPRRHAVDDAQRRGVHAGPVQVRGLLVQGVLQVREPGRELRVPVALGVPGPALPVDPREREPAHLLALALSLRPRREEIARLELLARTIERARPHEERAPVVRGCDVERRRHRLEDLEGVAIPFLRREVGPPEGGCTRQEGRLGRERRARTARVRDPPGPARAKELVDDRCGIVEADAALQEPGEGDGRLRRRRRREPLVRATRRCPQPEIPLRVGEVEEGGAVVGVIAEEAAVARVLKEGRARPLLDDGRAARPAAGVEDPLERVRLALDPLECLLHGRPITEVRDLPPRRQRDGAPERLLQVSQVGLRPQDPGRCVRRLLAEDPGALLRPGFAPRAGGFRRTRDGREGDGAGERDEPGPALERAVLETVQDPRPRAQDGQP